MAAAEHHAKLVASNRARSKGFLNGGCERPFALEQPPQFARERARRPLTPQDVERTVFGRCHQLGLQRCASAWPPCARLRTGKDDPLGSTYMFSFTTGRTSTAPSTSKIGQPFESSAACSRSRASIKV